MFHYIMKEEFLNKKPVFAEHIQEGFARYPHGIIKGKTERMQEFLERMLEDNTGSAYADFYYEELTRKTKDRFLKGLDKKELACFELFELSKGQVYYPLTTENVEFLSNITAREWLFSTFYFLNSQVTIWGNYQHSYPILANTKESLEKCFEIAREYKLQVE